MTRQVEAKNKKKRIKKMRTYRQNRCDCQNCYYQHFDNNNFQRPLCDKQHEIYSNGTDANFTWENSKIWRMNRKKDYSLTIADDCEDYLYLEEVKL